MRRFSALVVLALACAVPGTARAATAMHAFVVDPASGATQAVARGRTDLATQARLAWAPDGGALVLTDDRRAPRDTFTRTLVRYPADGGPPSDLGPVDCAPSQIIVSPRGDRRVELVRRFFTLSPKLRLADVFVLRASDGRALARVRGAVGAYDVAWSADGSRVAVPIADANLLRPRIRVFDATTGAAVATLAVPHLPGLSSQAFSPDATRLAFAVGDLGFRVADLRTGIVRRVGRSGRPPRRDQSRAIDEVAWSPAGDRFATLLHDGRVRLAGLDGVPGRAIAAPGRGRALPPAELSWSPDGAQLAWWASRLDREEGERTSLVVADATGGAARTLGAPRHGLGLDLRWSPDGTRLAFLFEDRPPWE